MTLNNYLVHVGNHPHYGDIAASQWAGENFATLDIRHPGPKLGFRPPARYNKTLLLYRAAKAIYNTIKNNAVRIDEGAIKKKTGKSCFFENIASKHLYLGWTATSGKYPHSGS